MLLHCSHRLFFSPQVKVDSRWKGKLWGKKNIIGLVVKSNWVCSADLATLTKIHDLAESIIT